MQKVNEEYYVYVEGVVNFTYYPSTGFVKVANRLSYFRSIEHFAYRGMEIDWIKSNINSLILYIKPPDHLSEEEVVFILGQAKENMHNQFLENEIVSRTKRLSCNIDNRTGNVIEEGKLLNQLKNLVINKKLDRYGCAEWFNHYNLDLIRPDNPLLIVSTKSRSIVIKEGKRLILSLFEKGELRRLTEDEYLAKID